MQAGKLKRESAPIEDRMIEAAAPKPPIVRLGQALSDHRPWGDMNDIAADVET